MKLIVKRSDGKIIAIINNDDGKLSAINVSLAMQKDVNRWLTRGLSEWIRDSSNCLRPRSTKPTDGEFFDRLENYIIKLGLIVEKE